MKNIIIFLACMLSASVFAQFRPTPYDTNTDAVAELFVRGQIGVQVGPSGSNFLTSAAAGAQIGGSNYTTSAQIAGSNYLTGATAGLQIAGSNFLTGNVRQQLTNSPTYFVATTGNDANPGTVGSPFLTIQKGVDTALAYDFGTNNVVIQVADGVYSGSVLVKRMVANTDWKQNQGVLFIHGNDSTPASVTITNASTNHLVMASQGCAVILGSVSVGSTNISNANLIDAQLWSTLAVSNILIGPSGSGASQITSETFGHVFTKGVCTFSGGGASALQALAGGDIWITVACTLTGTPAYTTAFAQAFANGMILFDGGSFSGSATGSRFKLNRGGTINTMGAFGVDTLPGNSSGTQDVSLGELSSQPVSIGNYFIYTNGLGGVTNASDAASGIVGEFTNRLLVAGSPQSLLNLTDTNVLSILLPSGDWNVTGAINFVGASATATRVKGSIGTTSNTTLNDGSQVFTALFTTTASFTTSVTVPTQRFSISTPTTVYLVAQASFSAGSMNCYGQISARRVR